MMIQKFHRLIASKVVWIGFCVVIAIAFIGLYMPGASQNQRAAEAAAAGELDGESVSQDEFRHHYVNIVVRFTMQDLNPPRITDEIDAIFRKLAWRRLVTMREAGKMGIGASNQEVIDRIKADPTFQVDGQYSAARYQAFVQQFLPRIGITETQFEQHIREETTINKLRFIVAQSALVPPHELKRRYNTFKDQFVVETALVTRELVEDDVTVSEEQAKAYFDENIEDFRIPEKADVSVVQFDVSEFLDELEEPVTIADARSFYDENPGLFTFVPPASDDEAGAGEEDAAAEEDAEADTDEIVETDTPPTPVTQPFEEIKEELLLSLSRRAALSLAAEKATDLAVEATPLGSSTSAPSFGEVAKTMGRNVIQLEPFSEKELLVGMGVGLTLNNAAFSLDTTPEQSVSDPVVGEDAVYVLKLNRKIPSRLPSFDEVSEAAHAAAREDAVASALSAKAYEVQEAAQAALLQGGTYANALKPFKIDAQKTQEFTAATGSLELENSDIIMPEIVTLNAGEVTAPLQVPEGYAIVHVVSRKDADPSDFAAVRDQLQTTLRRRQAPALFEEWQEQLLKNGNLVDRRDVQVPDEEDLDDEETDV